mmetsp:Transcript_53278/g.116690  ORF Transcript_53278/g.116690 Transcript_53278/m.116690 type:complete len:84 (+) Transcript_53278:538-789(+)
MWAWVLFRLLASLRLPVSGRGEGLPRFALPGTKMWREAKTFTGRKPVQLRTSSSEISTISPGQLRRGAQITEVVSQCIVRLGM